MGTVTTTVPGVTIQNPTLYFGNLAGGASSCGNTSAFYAGYCTSWGGFMPVAISGTVPLGTTIPITITIKDNYGNTFIATYASIATVGG